jgi:hypothetical protein
MHEIVCVIDASHNACTTASVAALVAEGVVVHSASAGGAVGVA